MIYVHIPFCRSFCTYCDFYSEIASKCRSCRDDERMFRYAEALSGEITVRKKEIEAAASAQNAVNTLYIGGGTPSVLPLSVLGDVVKTLSEVGISVPLSEFTVEVNPEDIVEKGPEYVEGLLRLGVNRVSMGVQSFDDGILKWMNRRHNAANAVKAYNILEDAGFENISIDLIFGLPQISPALWDETLERALSISSRGVLPKHISSYQLSVEPGSALASLVEKGMWSEAPEELCAAQYARLCEVLKTAGYNHYEISNFALPGFEAVHNSAYWKHVPYIGLGPGAHSYITDGDFMRKWNEPDLARYFDAMASKDLLLVQDGEILDEEQIALEKIMLALRTSEGISEDYLRANGQASAIEAALAEGNLVRASDARIRIPENRFFVSDSIVSSLF